MRGDNADRRIAKPRHMSEALVDILTGDIRDRVYEVGDPLPSERDLVEEFGVSRITVREALASLERSGLITQHPGTRARVRMPDPGTIIEMLSGAATLQLARPDGVGHFQDVRTLVETGVAELAAVRISDAQLVQLREALQQNEKSQGDVEAFARTDIAFHQVIADVLANPIISGFYLAVERWLSDVRRKTLAYEDQMRIAYAAHVAIFDAIAARNASGAREAMRRHLDQVNGVYSRIN